MITYSSNTFYSGTVATFYCIDGFQVDGTSMTTCGGDDSSTVGIWDNESPSCVRKSH